MKTRKHHITVLRHGALGLGGAFALLLFSSDVLAQGATPLELTVISNGGDTRSGSFGQMYSTIGEPLASEEVNGVDNETTWIGFWQILPIGPIDSVGSVREELRPAEAGATGIMAAAPNPFSASIGIELGLTSPGQVRLIAYDMAGRQAAILIDGWREAGTLRLEWRPEGMQGGSYLLRLTVDGKELPTQLVHYYR